MEQQPWETRSGEEIPDMAPSQGEDLAAMQRRQGAHRRDRASLEQQRHQDNARQLARLEERALNGRVKEMLQSRTAKIVATAVISLLVCYLLIWPRIDSAINPTASYGDLQSSLPQISLAASKNLGGEARAKITTQQDRWLVSYTLPKGSALFNGRRSSSTCGISFSVTKSQPSRLPLQWDKVFAKRCA